MPPRPRWPGPFRAGRVPRAMRTQHLWIAAAVLLVVLAAARLLAPVAISWGLRHAAGERGFTVRWERLRVRFPVRAELRGIVVCERAWGDTLVTADSLGVAVDPWSLLFLHPRASAVSIAHARLRIVTRHATLPDTLGPGDDLPAALSPRAAKLRHAADSLAGLLLAPARQLPRLEVRDLVVTAPAAEDPPLRGGRLAWLALDHAPGGMRLRATGALVLEHEIPFDVELSYGHDDRLAGAALLDLGDSRGGPGGRLRVTVNGALTQDRRAGVLRLADSTRVSFGRLPVALAGSLEQHGPRLSFRLAADGITEERILASVPREVLGPLTGLTVRGSFDYRLALDLDLARPDSVHFEADVIPHGLRLDSARTTLDLFRLEQPFLATIHLPHERLVTRELSSLNPFFRPLEGIDSTLVHAVLTNEDGGFFRHRGFNPDAIQLAIAFNVKAGAWRRGAGTVTMQLVRNLWLGHARTLSRKAQEVVLAWVLEHLTGVSKHRLLELYLNLIEWGPDVHGAAEATRYYFDEDPARITVDEALFLATVVPAPTKWRYRFAPDGSLRPFQRAQMHFIGRAMIAKGWLDPALLPPTDSLNVTLRGQAREVLFPADSTSADSTGVSVLGGTLIGTPGRPRPA
jgi:hypothetical protein